MPCRPMHVDLEVDPSATEKILLALDKTCDANDQATWKMTFELQEGNPLATVVKLDVEIDPENHPQAEATATAKGLDNTQQGQAKIAATVAKDPTVSDDDRKDAAQQVIAVRQIPANMPSEFPQSSNRVEVHGSPMHYIEAGTGDPIVFLHGNPTSSYLWRNVIPHLAPLGHCIAPDLVGMGRSGKPDIEYRFFDHVRYIDGFVDALGLQDVTLVIHDWGSALGFHYAMRHEKNVKAIAFLEAILMPLPDWQAFPAEMQEMFRAFRSPDVGWDLIVNQNVFIERILPGAILRKLTEEEMNRYREPFLEPKSRKPIWKWPNEIPIAGEPADVTAAVNDYNAKLRRSDLPKLLLYATPGAVITAPLVDWCRKNLKRLTVVNVGDGIHYLQEDHPHEIGTAIADWYAAL